MGAVAVASPGAAADVQAALRAFFSAPTAPSSSLPPRPAPPGPAPEVLVGPEAVCELAGRPADVVLNGVTGAAGLQATLAALDAGRVLALANKESLIIGGQLVTSRPSRARSSRSTPSTPPSPSACGPARG